MDYVKEKKSDMHNVVTKADQATESCPGCQVCSDKGGAAPRKLRVELAFLLIFALLAVGIVAAGYSYYCHHQKVFLAEVDRQLTSIAELKVGELEQWREDRQTDASLFFQEPNLLRSRESLFQEPG